MAEFYLTGRVPIIVTVDLETGEIAGVCVLDEESELDPAPEGDAEYAAAVALAEEGEWPAWELGL